MTIIEFYEQLSELLTEARERLISHVEAEEKLSLLLEESNKFGLEFNISPDILNESFLLKLDDERSFVEPDSYDDDYSVSSY